MQENSFGGSIMKILIKHNSPEKRTLVKLPNKKLIDEIEALISKDMRKEAVKRAFEKGEIIKELSMNDIGHADVNFILTENTVHYDLM